MRKIPSKMKVALLLLMAVFMIVYFAFFGKDNVAIGLMMVMIGVMNLKNDLSHSPVTSFIKILTLLIVLGISAFLNNPITVFGCILTFAVVFATTFSSYHLFGTSIYIPILMTYVMMLCSPVSIGDLPLRLLALAVGAVFIVGINWVLNKKRSNRIAESTVTGLISEIIASIDLKLNGGEIDAESFKTINEFYLSVFSRFKYKCFPSQGQISAFNIVKSFQYIGWILVNYDLTDCELKYLKKLLSNISNLAGKDPFRGLEVETQGMNLVLLNLEIIANEIRGGGLDKVGVFPDKILIKKSIRPIIKRQLSFRSAKFAFAFKMALVLTLWEVLTLIFNIPYTKWLYFASLSLMLPYVDDVSYNAKSRLYGTIVGVIAFISFLTAIHYIPVSQHIAMGLIFIISMVGMIYKIEDKFTMTIFTTVISITVSLIYITLPQAITLKILWVLVAFAVASVINFGFLPYSVVKETRNNLKISHSINENAIMLIRQKCENRPTFDKTTLMVLNNLVRTNVEVNDENMELYTIQGQVNELCNFILGYLDIHEFSDDAKEKFIKIIEGQKPCSSCDICENVMINSIVVVMKKFGRENEMMEELN